MATQGQDGGGTVYLRAGLDVSGIEDGAQRGKQAVKDMTTSVVNDTAAAGKSIASLGGASPNFDRLQSAFSGVTDSVKAMVQESDRGLKAFINQIQNTAAGAGNVTQAIADKFEARAVLKGFDPAIVQPYIEGLRKLAQENKAVADVAQYEASAQKQANDERRKATAEFKNFERSAQAARIELLSFGKTAAEKFQIRAEFLGIDKNAATQKIIADLKAAEAAAAQTAATMGDKLVPATNAAGMSAKAYSAAMRSVPAQITDIVVGLQGGQAPMTVLLQQGGQLKDMFGGVGNAAKAIGGYIAGLVNPLTLVAAGAATFGYAAYQASEDVKALRLALIETGTQGITSLAKLDTIAGNLRDFGVSSGTASEALVTFIRAGAKVDDTLEGITRAAIELARVGGPSVEETAKAFVKLAKDPLADFDRLTLATYAQIEALIEQGRRTEAVKLAQDAFSAANKNMANALAASMGPLDTSIAYWKKHAAELWDNVKAMATMAGLRDETGGQEKKRLTRQRDEYLAQGQTGLAADIDKQLQYLARLDAAQQQGIKNLERENELKRLLKDFDEKDPTIKKQKEINDLTAANTKLLEAGLITQEQYNASIKAFYSQFDKKGASNKDSLNDQQRSLASYTESLQKRLEKEEKLTEAQKAQNFLLSLGAYGKIPQVREYVTELAKQVDIQDAANAATKAAVKAYEEYQQQQEKVLDGYKRSADAVEKSLQKMQDEEAALVVAAEKNISLAEAVAEVELARLRELQTKKLAEGADGETLLALQREIDAREKLAAAIGRRDARTLADKAAKESQKAADKAASEWQRAAEKIQDSITDALMRGFESGKGFAENLRDAVVNMFKTMVLRPVVEMGVRGGLSILGMGGAAGGASAAEVLGNVGNAGSTINSLSQLGGLPSWLTDFGGSAANSIIKAGELAYQAGFEEIGSSMMSLQEAGNFSAVADGLNMVGDGLGYLNAAMAASEGKWGKAIGTGIGTYFGGPIGAAIGGAIGGWVDEAFGGGREYTTGTGITGKFSGNTFAGRNYQDWRNDGSSGFFGIGASGASSGTNYSAMDSALQKSLGRAYGNIITQTSGFALALGSSADTITGFQKDIKLSLGSDAEANKKAIAEMFKGIANEVAGTVLDAQYIREGEGAADTLARLATNLTIVNGSLDTLGDNLLIVSQFGGDAASSLIDAFGGLQSYQSAISNYYQKFYTSEERAAKTREQLSKQLSALGFSVPDSIEAYRQLVNAQDLTTDSGRKAYAALISMSDAFASITTAVDALQESSVSAATSIKSLMDSLARERNNVASAMQSINPNPVMSYQQIATGIEGAKVSSPQLGAVTAATATLTAAQAATASATQLANLTSTAAANVSNAQASYNTAMTSLANASNTLANTPTQIWEHYVYNTLFGDRGGDRLVANPAYATALAARNAAQVKVDQAAQNYANVQAVYGPTAAQNPSAQAALSAAQAQEAAAKKALIDRQTEYNDAVKAYAVDAAKSITVLGKLREETVRFYEAQKALAETMTASATNLRNAIITARESQLDSQQLAQKRLADYAQSYSMALSTTGYTQAGYADKMASLLPQIATSLQDSAGTASEWAAATGVLFAQADAIANQLDANSPKDYQEQSIELLNNIDTILTDIGSATQVIVDAVKGGAGLTAAGLREVVKALGGTPTFATGGYHSGGLRLVGENGPELEVTGPSRIFDASQTAEMLRGGSGMTSAELMAMRMLLADLRDGQAQTAAMMNRMVRINEKWDGDGLPTTRSETA